MGKLVEFTAEETELIQGLDVTEHLTDLGNCKRFITLAGGRFRFLYDMGKWIYFDGKSWKVDKAGRKALGMAELTVRSIYGEAEACEVKMKRKEIASHARSSESITKIRAMLKLAEPGLSLDAEELDPEPWFLNCQNGVVDLRTGKLRDHDKDDLIDKIIPVDYEPEAKCPEWLKFLNMIMDGNDEMVHFLQRAVGYSLTGHTDERCLFILHGEGRNGKSTFTETIADLLSGYAQKTPAETLLLKKFGDGIPSDLARLRGSRFVYASETAEGRRLNESRIKELTGDRDAITARFLYQELFTFIPQFKLWLHTNHRPSIKGTDQAVWDRIRLIPFDIRIPDNEVKPRREVDDIFKSEWSGILTWAINGCLDWKHDKLRVPEPVLKSTAQYRDESDSLKEFIEDCCVIEDNVEISKGDLYDAYKTWSFENKEQYPLSKKKFGQAIKQRGFDDFRKGSGRYWSGITK